MKHLVFSTGIFLSLFILPSCAPIKPVTINKLESARVIKMDSKGLEVEVSMRINNPNRMGFTIYNTDLDVSINDKSLGKAKAKQKVRVKRNSDAVHTFVIQSDFSSLFGDLSSLIKMRNPTVNVKGEIKVGKWYYKKKFPIDVKERISL